MENVCQIISLFSRVMSRKYTIGIIFIGNNNNNNNQRIVLMTLATAIQQITKKNITTTL